MPLMPMGNEPRHAALRRLACATSRMVAARQAYEHDPTDSNGEWYHAAWIELRAAVDALVGLPLTKDLALAIAPATQPGET